VRFYDVAANEQQAKFNHRAAVLTRAFGDDTRALSGGLDNGVRECILMSRFPCLPADVCTYDGASLDLETERMVYLGNHSNAVSAMNFAREKSMFISLPLVVSLIHTGAH